jgi:phosphoribosyl-AMP cyclohydrolase / phosphoribosyl-ATP pyrophosphohydrolase
MNESSRSGMIRSPEDLDGLDFEKSGGVVSVIVQDAGTGQVLMMAYADREALALTLQSGEMHFRSRTRGPWHKGATSGNIQRLVELRIDCDGDAVLALVWPAGPACHTGRTSCFGGGPPGDPLDQLAVTIAERSTNPADPGYTRKLLDDRNLRLKKLGEEAAELAVALADGDLARAAEEAADLLYHQLVALQAVGLTLSDIRRVLAGRAR